jgi:hypothetical protein
MAVILPCSVLSDARSRDDTPDAAPKETEKFDFTAEAQSSQRNFLFAFKGLPLRPLRLCGE